MPPPLSAVGAISPALEQTKRRLFQPFRFGFWARLGVVSMVTGEFVGGGWGGASGFNIPTPDREEDGELGFALLTPPDQVWQRTQEYLPWILVGVVALVALGLIVIYIASVFRFVLFDAVLRDRCQLVAGWRRWQKQGSGFFLWWIGLVLAMLAGAAVLIAGPVYLAWMAGIFRQPNEHVGLLVVGGLALFFLLMGFFLLGALVFFLSKDFVVPLMALEDLGVGDAWRRLLPMLGAEKAAYGIYLLMKIVLAVGSSMLFGIINFFVLLATLIPLGIAGAVLVLAGMAAGLSLTVYTIGTAIVLLSVAVSAIIYAMAFVSAPAMFFFQSYALHFLGSRYPALDAMLAPPPPAIPPAPAPAPAS